MARLAFVLACALGLLASSVASGAIVEHSFNVNNLTVTRLCQNQSITVVNESYPGPTIYTRDGDTLIIHVLNQSPYNITIHWHGVFQLLSAWADGPAYVTQCPIPPGQSYTYKFNITGQEGTLWWHAHISWLRATVHGALIIHPKADRSFPFPKPDKEVPIILGDWYNGNVVDIEQEGLSKGIAPNLSNAYTINGLPGDLYECSQNQTYQLSVVRGKTYLLRLINAALNNELFFKIANHSMTVVAIDASYTTPYVTDVVVTGPGQTTDVLVKFNQLNGSYYMAATPYASADPTAVAFDNSTTRGIIIYKGYTSSTPIMPPMPNPHDTPLAHKFFTNLTGLLGGPHWVPVPRKVDEHMFVTIGVNLAMCPENATCQGLFNNRMSASMNNESFMAPTNMSMLEAHFNNVSGVYTRDFPNEPPVKFDYTNTNLSLDLSLIFAPKSTKVKTLKFNSTVQLVFQNTAFLAIENHPMHLHGFSFHVLAQGFGNYDPINDPKKFNFVNPQVRNTIGVPVGGWAVIRFRANNPGMWYVHCHLDVHLSWGLAMAFEVENGGTPESTLPPPPLDLPKC